MNKLTRERTKIWLIPEEIAQVVCNKDCVCLDDCMDLTKPENSCSSCRILRGVIELLAKALPKDKDACPECRGSGYLSAQGLGIYQDTRCPICKGTGTKDRLDSSDREKELTMKEKLAIQDMVCKGCMGCVDGCEKLYRPYLEARIDKIQQYWFGTQAFKHKATGEILALFPDEGRMDRPLMAKALVVIEGSLLADEPEDKRLGFIYRMAHVGIGECEHQHWIEEMEECYQQLLDDNVISPLALKEGKE